MMTAMTMIIMPMMIMIMMTMMMFIYICAYIYIYRYTYTVNNSITMLFIQSTCRKNDLNTILPVVGSLSF